MRINFRYELRVLCARRQASETSKKYSSPNRLVISRHFWGLGTTVFTLALAWSTPLLFGRATQRMAESSIFSLTLLACLGHHPL
jgi:hypothetical protein